MIRRKDRLAAGSIAFLFCLYGMVSMAQTPTWLLLTPAGSLPTPRSGHTMIYDEANGRALIFGGQDPTERSLDDVHALILTAGSERWAALTLSGRAPQSRYMASAIYDAANQRMIVFGGANVRSEGGQVIRTYLNDVWSLDLTPGQEAWTEIIPAGTAPSARYMHAAAYDAGNQRMIVFGGGTYEGSSWRLLNNTWALDLTPGQESWTELRPQGLIPKPKNPYRAVYVPPATKEGSAKMVIFGGWNGWVALNDTYTLDLTAGQETWSKVRPAGYDPDVRFAHTLVYDTVQAKIILFSGWEWGGRGYLNDTWLLDLNTEPELWTELRPAGTPPTPRDFSNAVFIAAQRRMVIFAGRNGNDTHTLTLP